MIVLTVVAGACIVAVLVAQARVLSRLTAGPGPARPPSADDIDAARAASIESRRPSTAPRLVAGGRAVSDRAPAVRTTAAAIADPGPVAPEDVGWVPVAPARPRERPSGGDAGPMAAVLDVLRRRPSVRRGVSVASLVAMAVAIGMLGYPFFTNIIQGRIQDRLEREFEDDLAGGGDGEIELGDGLVRVTIPSLRVRVVVVEGTTPQALEAGAGHYEHTAMPCELGNVGIAGHRTTYGRPFHDIDLLRQGHRIVLETPSVTCTYEVIKDPWITTPRDIAVLASSGDSLLTLTTCHPKGSARQRLVVQARLVSVEEPAR